MLVEGAFSHYFPFWNRNATMAECNVKNLKPTSTGNLSSIQFKLWNGVRRHPETPIDNMALFIRLGGTIEEGSFNLAFEELVLESESLRTVFEERSGVPNSQILERVPSGLARLDFRDRPNSLEAAREWAVEQSSRLFELSRCSYSAALLRVGDEEYVWYLNQHHLITDATTCQLLHERMSELYLQALNGSQTSRIDRSGYGDYVDWERNMRTTQRFSSASQFWREREAEVLPVPEYYGSPSKNANERSQRVNSSLNADRVGRLRDLANQGSFRSVSSELAFFDLVSTIYLTFLYRVSMADPLSLSIAYRNRQEARFHQALGCFVELLPVQVSVSKHDTFRELHRKIATESLKTFQHAVPGSNGAGMAKTPGAVLNYVTARITEFAGFPVQVEWLHAGFVDPVHSIRLEVYSFGDTEEISLSFDLNEGVFSKSVRALVPRHFLAVVDAFLSNPDGCISDFEIATDEEEVGQLGQLTSSSVCSLCDEESIVTRFADVVCRFPDRIAVTDSDRSLTFQELDDASSRLALCLRQHWTKPDQVIAIFADRRCQSIVAMFGALKAGFAYLPLDVTDPARRLATLLEESSAVLLLDVQEEPAADRPELAQPRIRVCLENLCSGGKGLDQGTVSLAPNALAYILFTSGSTGRPKAVAIEHGSVLHLVDSLKEAIYGGVTVKSDDSLRVALVAPFVFDASVQQIFGALLQGHELQIVPEGCRKDGLELLRYFDRHRTDISDGTPGHLRLMVGAVRQTVRLSLPRHLIIGGETLSKELVATFRRSFERRTDTVSYTHLTLPTTPYV